jgi:uncharacterized protein (DUF952 family)
MSGRIAYKIMSAQDWSGMQASGRYLGSAVDLADGYIHMSAPDQVAATAARHYAGRSDLVLLSVALDGFDEALVWEASRGGALFPHLYAPLPIEAITSAHALEVAEDGAMTVEGRSWP